MKTRHWATDTLLETTQILLLLLMILALTLADWLVVFASSPLPFARQAIPYVWLALMACWVCLGPGRAYWRLPLLAAFLVRIVWWFPKSEFDESLWPRETAAALLLVLLPCLLCARVACLAIRRTAPVQSKSWCQFSVRELLALTLVCSVAIVVVRAYRWSDPGFATPTYLFTTLGACYGVLTLVALWALLYRNQVVIGMLLTLGAAVASATAHMYLCQAYGDVPAFLMAHVTYALTLATPLLVLRASGCRIVTRAIPLDFLLTLGRRLSQRLTTTNLPSKSLLNLEQERC